MGYSLVRQHWPYSLFVSTFCLNKEPHFIWLSTCYKLFNFKKYFIILSSTELCKYCQKLLHSWVLFTERKKKIFVRSSPFLIFGRETGKSLSIMYSVFYCSPCISSHTKAKQNSQRIKWFSIKTQLRAWDKVVIVCIFAFHYLCYFYAIKMIKIPFKNIDISCWARSCITWDFRLMP